jgi:alpha-ketoglutarate-dependent 2,4-dichlorophenoxyacetate dioxygenase
VTLSLWPLHPTLAAEVSGVDLAYADAELAADLAAANDRYSILVFRDQKLDVESQVRFASMFGPLEKVQHRAKRGMVEEITEISNVAPDGTPRGVDDDRRIASITNELWHTDSSFKTVPAKYSMLYADAVPVGGHVTEFADLRAAYDALDEEMKERIDDLVAEHSTMYSEAIIGYQPDHQSYDQTPVYQRVARRLPSGRMSLYIASHAGKIVGWSVPDGRSLIYELIDHATKPQFVYRHEWRANDLVWWDNRCTMHRARANRQEMGDIRDMRRTTVSDVTSTLEQPRALAGSVG